MAMNGNHAAACIQKTPPRWSGMRAALVSDLSAGDAAGEFGQQNGIFADVEKACADWYRSHPHDRVKDTATVSCAP